MKTKDKPALCTPWNGRPVNPNTGNIMPWITHFLFEIQCWCASFAKAKMKFREIVASWEALRTVFPILYVHYAPVIRRSGDRQILQVFCLAAVVPGGTESRPIRVNACALADELTKRRFDVKSIEEIQSFYGSTIVHLMFSELQSQKLAAFTDNNDFPV